MSRVSNIIKTAERKTETNGKYERDLLPERQRLEKYLEREEEEKLKSTPINIKLFISRDTHPIKVIISSEDDPLNLPTSQDLQ